MFMCIESISDRIHPVASMAALEPEEKGIFIGLAIMQTLLFVISILGSVHIPIYFYLFHN